MKLRLGRGLAGWICLLLLSAPAFSTADDEFDDNDEGVTIEVDQMEEEDSYVSPVVEGPGVYFAEHFDDIKEFNKKWIKSEAKKQGVDETIAKYDGKWEIRAPARKILRDDLGLVLTTEAKHAAISALLNKPFVFKDKPLIVQYEVTMQEGQSCGGAYLKLLSATAARTPAELRAFHDQTPYTVMFGPDKCGNDNKLHFIMRHKNPNNGSYEEKHAKKPSERLDELYKDKAPHLYQLEVRPDNTFTVRVDGRVVNSGSLLADLTPPVNPPAEVDDPDDVKPHDWDEREKIVDPAAVKPDDWDESAPAQIVDSSAVKPDGWLDDEPETIPDPTAVKPEDWDEEMDGEWEAPLIDNPACKDAPGCGPWSPPTIPNPNYKGVWKAPLIPNPAYRGKWFPRKIPNPDYFHDDQPFRMTPISAVGFELWSMSPLLLFDNLLVTDDPELAALWAQQTFELKRARLARDSASLWGRMLRAMNYKPGWWAAYAVYCAIPVAAYIYYLLAHARKDSVLERVTRFAADNPWVYAVGIVVAFLFVGLFVYLCCGPRPEEGEDPKKTDAVTEDDPHQSEGEGDVEGEVEGDAEGEGEHAPAAQERGGKASLEQQPSEQEDAEESPEETEAPSGDTHRKRKPRKE